MTRTSSRALLAGIALLAAAPAFAQSASESNAALVKRGIDAAAKQYATLLPKVQSKEGFPRTVENGGVKLVGVRDWTSGFFPGSLWYLFEATGDKKWRAAARDYTARMAPAKFDKTQHDLGFMLGASYGNGYRLTKDPSYRDALLAGATTLVTRYNPKVGSIQSWDLWKNSTWAFPVIIDNMMNLELLTWSARESKEPYYRDVALTHADTTIKNHFRPDGSSVHLVDYDPQTGAIRGKVTVQGNADSSSWARGQAWGLYGYTMMFRETKKPEYLEQAHKIAAFFMNHPRLPQDKVPYWDFDDAAIPNAPRDSSAAAITASALLELAGFSDKATAQKYRDFATAQLRSLASPVYLAATGENGGFLLKHATGHKPAGKEIDVPLNYADYYFLEALLRLKAASATH
jgi:rhamnogalacturonyl hydrolase YesR